MEANRIVEVEIGGVTDGGVARARPACTFWAQACSADVWSAAGLAVGLATCY